MNKENIELRSEEFQEILGKTPHWILRSGIAVVFLFLATGLLLINYLHYADKVPSKVVITTQIATSNVISPTQGYLRLLLKSNADVKEGNTIAYIENSARYNDILILDNLLRTMPSYLVSKKDLQLLRVKYDLHLGELQYDYLKLAGEVERYKKMSLSNKSFKSLAVDKEIVLTKKLNGSLEQQRDLAHNQLLSIRTDNRNDTLHKTTATSAHKGLINYQNDVYTLQNTLESLNTKMLENAIKLQYLELDQKQMTDNQHLGEELLLQDINLSIEQIKSYLDLWKTKYIISSPANGKLYILPDINDKILISANQSIFKILPTDTIITVTSYIPIQNSGKVKPGQEMLIKLDNYPYEEFGMVKAKIETISYVPINGCYTAKARLYNGLTSTRKIKIIFKQEMSGTGEIITKDNSILSRILYQFYHLIN